MLCIGTEIDQLSGPSYKSYWDGIISALRAQDPCLKLTYAADWDNDLSPWQWGGTGLPPGTGNLATQISFASELDYLGVDVYAPISNAANPTLAATRRGLDADAGRHGATAETYAVTGGQSLIPISRASRRRSASRCCSPSSASTTPATRRVRRRVPPTNVENDRAAGARLSGLLPGVQPGERRLAGRRLPLQLGPERLRGRPRLDRLQPAEPAGAERGRLLFRRTPGLRFPRRRRSAPGSISRSRVAGVALGADFDRLGLSPSRSATAPERWLRSATGGAARSRAREPRS